MKKFDAHKATPQNSASPEARKRQEKYNECVDEYLKQHGNTSANKTIAAAQCSIHFLLG